MIRFALWIALVLMLSACQQPLKKVHVGTTPFFGEAAFYVAQKQGIFEDHGLDVIPHRHAAGKGSLKRLYAGELDIAHTAELPFVRALANSTEYNGNIAPRICTNMIYNMDMQKIIARKDRGISEPKDLENKRIGFFKGTTLEFFLDTFLLEHNIPDSAVDKKNVNILKQFEAMLNGSLDAVVSWEPYASKILSRMEGQTFELGTRIDHSTLWLVVSSRSYISQNPEAIRSYLRALKEAQNYIKEHPEETQQLLARKTDTSKKIIAGLWPTIDYELSMGEYMMVLMEDQQRWLRQKGYVEQKAEKVNFERLIHFEAMEEVYPDGITIIR